MKMEEDKQLTKKQRKEFLRLWIGSILFNQDFGFDDVYINSNSILSLEDEKLIQAYKYLKNERPFTSTSEIYEYVKSIK